MQKTTTLILAVLFASTIATANHASQTVATEAPADLDPGLIGPDSPLYGLEVAADNAAVDFGFTSAGSVVEERAAEYHDAVNRSSVGGAEKALESLNAVAEKATSEDSEGLEKAQQVLQSIQEQTPNMSDKGLETALDNVGKAMERQSPVNGTDRDVGGGGVPGDLPV